MGTRSPLALPLFAALVLALPAVGCSRTMAMSYTAPPVLAESMGDVRVEVTDARADAGVDKERNLVGQVRSGAGVPYGIWTAEGREPPRVLREVIADALRGAGFRVVDSASAPVVHATLQRMWCDGYLNYESSLLAPLELRGGVRPWTWMLESRGGVTLVWGPSDLNKGFTRMLDGGVNALLEQFRGAEFRAAMGAGP